MKNVRPEIILEGENADSVPDFLETEEDVAKR
jgi:hypothetical protein